MEAQDSQKDDLIVVTGGAGFIGSNLCKKLVELGYDVLSIDNYSTGSEDNHVNGVTYVNDLAENIHEIVERIYNVIPKAVFHLGEYSRVEQSYSDSPTVLTSNYGPLAKIINYCHEFGVKLIYSGSSTKFAHWDSESDVSPYTMTKALNTELLDRYGKIFSSTFSYAIVYFYNAYGPNEICEGKYSTLIAKFKRLYAQNQPLTVTLPGDQRRNFTHVADIVSGLIHVLDSGYGDGYGIGSDKSYTVLEIAEMFVDSTRIEMLPRRRGNRKSAELITTKTKELGWKPTHDLKDYVKKAKYEAEHGKSKS